MNQRGYCVLIDSLCEGSVVSIHDKAGGPFVFPTRFEAEREIAELAIARLQEFMEGSRDFESAITIEEYVCEVELIPGL